MRKNCWEVRQCGREPGSFRSGELGVCPAAMEKKLDGVHGGVNAGRACWVVAGTMCGGIVQGTFSRKFENCEKCEFYQHVKKDERNDFMLSISLLNRLRERQTA